ncbi:DUF2505 domain-containing protein [Nocardia donostiensis]|uniref:DUF2505 domain-containing protein n=1 Tax=Nocardia donostiensis TaxID=1538463 RepID=A0A1W0BC31_9NOCA|nr:DUF2505 domain-containing protein [Nocardia donostiensis]ONM47147.1 hypothetical protein B0T46_19435 [Nocardia donostiensis]OQS15182.1 hypothetical protein B0T36_11065 [Nocardia donostiensis]OQS20132.1 hypothetical protein B0T44_11425 [Nocardia donostiensis]
MSRKFRFTVPYTISVKELHRALTGDQMWQARFTGAETATLDLAHPGGPGTAHIAMSEKIRPDKIPAIVRKVLKSDLVVSRTDDWQALDGEIAAGTFHGTSTGISSEMTGSYELRPTAEGCEIEVAGTVKVKVPLVGGAIEPLAEQLQHRVLHSERKFIEKWVAEQRSA